MTPEEELESLKSQVIKLAEENEELQSSAARREGQGTQELKIEKARAVSTQANFIDPIAYAQMRQTAQDFINAGALPQSIKNAEQVLMMFQAGFEMGMKPVESLNSLYIVNGKVTIFGAALVRRLRLHGWTIQYEDTPTSCKAIIFKGGEVKLNEELEFDGFIKNPDEIYNQTMTMEMAQKSGMGAGPGWKDGAFRVAKLRYGALSLIVRTYVPEVLGSFQGIKEVEEDFNPEDRSVVRANIQDALNKRKEKLVDIDPVSEIK